MLDLFNEGRAEGITPPADKLLLIKLLSLLTELYPSLSSFSS